MLFQLPHLLVHAAHHGQIVLRNLAHAGLVGQRHRVLEGVQLPILALFQLGHVLRVRVRAETGAQFGVDLVQAADQRAALDRRLALLRHFGPQLIGDRLLGGGQSAEQVAVLGLFGPQRGLVEKLDAVVEYREELV